MIDFSREHWGARHGRGNPLRVRPVPLVVFHHSWRPHLPAGSTHASEIAAMRSMERFHVETNGWAAIAYQWLIFLSGHVFEGRGWGRVGSHTKGQNSKSVGVCFVMNGDEHQLTPAAIEAARELLGAGIAGGEILPNYQVRGHHDFSEKSCPGTLVYPRLEELRP